MPPGELIVKAHGLEHRYEDGTAALRQISLEIREGEFIALLGGNGAGKTTLAKCLASLIKPSSGMVTYVQGEQKPSKTHGPLHTIGYVFQNPEGQLFCGSVREEIEYGLRNCRVSRGEIRSRLHYVASLLQIESLLARHPHTLSRGQKRRVALAAVLVLKPRVIMLDEPTVGQDAAGLHGMMEALEELNRTGTAIVLITHDLALAARHCKRAVVMAEGNIIADGPLPDVLANEALLQGARLVSPRLAKEPSPPIGAAHHGSI